MILTISSVVAKRSFAFSLLFLFFLSFLSPFFLFAKEIPASSSGTAVPSSARTVTVISESVTRMKPEIAVVTVYFTAYSWTVEKARLKVDKQIKEYLQKLEKEKISTSQVEIGDPTFKPSYQFNRDLKANVPSNFLVSRKVVLQFDDIAAIEKVMDISISMGPFLLESVRLTVKDPDALRAKAFEEALEEGKKKAESLVKPLGAATSSVLSIEEERFLIQDINLVQENDFSMQAASQIKPEEKTNIEKEKATEGSIALSEADRFSSYSDKVRAYTQLKITFQLQ